MAVDYGTDVALVATARGTLDLPAAGLALVSGRANLVTAIWKRFVTRPRRGVVGKRWPTYGYRIQDLMAEEWTPRTQARAAAAIAAQAEEDPRVRSASATLVMDRARQALRITLAIDTADGPFELVLEASRAALTVGRVTDG